MKHSCGSKIIELSLHVIKHAIRGKSTIIQDTFGTVYYIDHLPSSVNRRIPVPYRRLTIRLNSMPGTAFVFKIVCARLLACCNTPAIVSTSYSDGKRIETHRHRSSDTNELAPQQQSAYSPHCIGSVSIVTRAVARRSSYLRYHISKDWLAHCSSCVC